jgi:hypothetical protein
MLAEIQYSVANYSDYNVVYTAMVIYCPKVDYRELRLSKLLK